MALSRNASGESEIARSLASDSISNSCAVWAPRWSALQTTRQDLLHFGRGTMWDWKFEINEYTDALIQIVDLCNRCPYFWSIKSHKSNWGFFPPHPDFVVYWNRIQSCKLWYLKTFFFMNVLIFSLITDTKYQNNSAICKKPMVFLLNSLCQGYWIKICTGPVTWNSLFMKVKIRN